MALINLEKAKNSLDKLKKYPDDTIWRVDDPPESEKNYLVTDNEGQLAICRWTDLYFGQHSGEWHWHTGTYQKVAAWMPLPDAYKGENELH